MRWNTFARYGSTVLFAAVAAQVGGCASSGDSDHGRHAAVPGMMCPKCETVWVGPHVSGQGTKVQAYQWGREAVCPDCDAMARAYVEDGRTVLHDCPTCRVTPQPVRPVKPPASSHPRGTHG